MKKKKRTWKPERLFVEDFWSLAPTEVEFFEAICALAGSTKGCEQGFNRSFGGTEIWRKICQLYEYFLGAARRSAFPIKGNLTNYPDTAIEVCPEIENRLRCYVPFRELVCFSLVEKVALPWELQTALGTYQSLSFRSAVSVSVARDKRSTGGKCIVSGITFPPDFDVRIEVLTKRDQALVLAQAAASVLIHLTPSTEKKDLHAKIKQLPLIGKTIREFCGAHTMRDWLKPVTPGEGKKGRPLKNKSLSSPPKHVELPINQALPLYSPHAREMECYLARLKTAIFAIAATLASESTLSEEEICTHELIQHLLQPVCITINLIEKKLEWAKTWTQAAVEQVRKK